VSSRFNNVLDFGASGLDSSPGRSHCVMVFSLIVPFSTKVYKGTR